ncbi:MAG: NAD(+)/NADH kinase [Eubacteriales bacterium]|nr:NAD(+)/NADH kinase [Eubacteriales bacterium]
MIVTNKGKDPGLARTEEICRYLESAGCSVSVYADEISGKEWEAILAKEKERAEGMLVLGGDGTLLRAARDTVESKIPLLGINLGTLGYLAEVEQSSLIPALQQLVDGDYMLEERMLLAGQVIRKQQRILETRALNDITITRNGRLQMLYFQIYVNGKLLKEYHADGIIVATPTGSTGYNLSAGGPIVEPSAKVTLLTPVCAHTLQTRSVILRAEDNIVIRIGEREGKAAQPVEVCFDGNQNLGLAPGDEVHITRSNMVTTIIKLKETSFLDVLNRKMSE